MEREINSVDEMLAFGRQLGELCHGGEVIELVGDIGAGKTTLTKGIAAGMGVDDEVQSPTFTLSRTYHTKKGGILAHYDFYRLNDPGILGMELADASHADDTTVVIEWADTVQHVLPEDRIILKIAAFSEEGRHVTLIAQGPKGILLVEALK
ncbi:MAG: tRNA (adenosine(37)-N6)-threonylcarbamoyltransferase complex ATPase subunit type 1 TsaE [Candidatus Saccharimonas sp.]